MYQIGLAWTVYRLTNSTAEMGIVLALNFIPQLVLVLLGGAMSDKISRRVVVFSSDTAAAIVTAGLAVISMTHSLSIAVLMAGALLLGVISAFYNPAYAAMNKDLLSDEELSNANSLLTISGNLARVLGPAIGGIAFGFGGVTLLFGLDSASFAIAAVAMLFTHVTDHGQPGKRRIFEGLLSGVAYTLRTRWLLLVSAITIVSNCMCLAPTRVLLPALVRSQRGGPEALGLLNAAEIAATVLGVMLVQRLDRGSRPLLVLSILAGVLGLGTVVLGIGEFTFIALITGSILIGGGLAFNVVESTLLQTRVPAQLLSRVFSVNILLSYSLLPVGYIVSGFLARRFGAFAVLAAGGLALLAVCACVPLLATRTDTAEVADG